METQRIAALRRNIMKKSVHAAIILALTLPLSCAAYDTQLSAAAIHEAYVLGQRNDKSTGDFLAPYLSDVTEAQNDVHIAQIELLTPYAQIVDLTRQKATAGYSEAQATEDYNRDGATVKVNVVLMLPAAYPKSAQTTEAPTPPPATGQQKSDIRPENFWQNFHFNLKQNGKTVPSRKINNQPIHSTATKDAPAVLDGENVWLEYDVKDVAAAPTTVEVVTPQGKVIKANFDLNKLK